MLLIRPVLICMILSPLIQYVLDIPHKCRATVLDLLLEQKYSYLLNKRIICRENRLLALAWMWLRSTRRAARRLIGRWDAQQRFTLGLNGEIFRLRPNTNLAILSKHAKTKIMASEWHTNVRRPANSRQLLTNTSNGFIHSVFFILTADDALSRHFF